MKYVTSQSFMLIRVTSGVYSRRWNQDFSCKNQGFLNIFGWIFIPIWTEFQGFSWIFRKLPVINMLVLRDYRSDFKKFCYKTYLLDEICRLRGVLDRLGSIQGSIRGDEQPHKTGFWLWHPHPGVDLGVSFSKVDPRIGSAVKNYFYPVILGSNGAV